MGVSSPMSDTSSNIGSEGKLRDFSNVSKIIEKQGIKGILEYCAKGKIRVISPMPLRGNGGIIPMCSKPL